MLDKLLTIEEAAARLGFSASTIWRYIRAGKLTSRRVFGRTVINVDEVDALDVPKGGGRWRPTARTQAQPITRGPSKTEAPRSIESDEYP